MLTAEPVSWMACWLLLREEDRGGESMKVVAFNGSARAKGNTAILLNVVLDELGKEGIETELVSLAGKGITGCRACFKCFEKVDGHCGRE